MDDLPLAAPIGANLPEYTVSELSFALKRRIEESFAFVRVRGEVSGFKRHASGHWYLSLKDTEAVLDAVCWRNTAIRQPFTPENGMEVVCTGRLSTYPGRSKYQLIIDTMSLAGEGALLKMIEDRRRRLAAEGLFAAERKKKLPYLPQVIGVVTSPTGAVIRDILHRLVERFPRHVLLWPVAVQGDAAAAQITAAIEGFNRLPATGAVPRPDLLIVARGGGSLEDLMPFNEEMVVRAAAASAIPLISAVGHETDTTLIDYASDLRAPTPTAAAEFAVPVRLDLMAELAAKTARLSGGLARLLGERRLHLAGLARGLPQPQDLIGAAAQRLDDRAERLRLAIAMRLRDGRQRLDLAAASLRPAALSGEIDRFWGRTSEMGLRLAEAMMARQRDGRQRLDLAGASLRPAALSGEIARFGSRIGEVGGRLAEAMARHLDGCRAGVDNYAGRLATHSERHESLLRRGYVVVRDAKATVVTEGASIVAGAVIELEFHDARVGAIAGKKVRRTARHSPAPPTQGRLL